MFSSRAAINTGSPDLGRVVSPIPGRGFAADTKGCESAAVGFFFSGVHGSSICPNEPRNATQTKRGALRA
jgi:hypothetical protein